MKRVLVALSMALLGAALLRGAARADSPVITDFRVDAPDRMTVGDRVRYQVKLEADEGTRVALAPGSLPNELSLVEGPQVSTSDKGGGRIEVDFSATMAVFAIGDIELPPLKLRYRDRTGATGDVLTPVARVVVASLLPQSGQVSPRDLKPQAEIGSPPTVEYVIQAVREGWYTPEDLREHSMLSAGGAAMAPFGAMESQLPAQLVEMVRGREQQIKAGEFRVPIDETPPGAVN